MSLASLPTGLVMSLGTEWGLFRHYWILPKLLITVLATILLLVHMQPVGHLARVVAETTLASGELAGLRIQLLADAGAALLALLVATALSVYKPRGLTWYGRRKQHRPDANGGTGDDIGARPDRGSTTSTPRWVSVFGIIVLVLVVLFVLRHLTGGGLEGHIP